MEECGLMKKEQRWPRPAEGAYTRSQALTSKVAKIRIRRKSQKGHISITRHCVGCTGDFIPSINWFSTFYLFFFLGGKAMEARGCMPVLILPPTCSSRIAGFFARKLRRKSAEKYPEHQQGITTSLICIFTPISHTTAFSFPKTITSSFFFVRPLLAYITP